MKVKVISVFRDKFTGKYYTPGEVIEVGEEARVLDMESRRKRRCAVAAARPRRMLHCQCGAGQFCG